MRSKKTNINSIRRLQRKNERALSRATQKWLREVKKLVFVGFNRILKQENLSTFIEWSIIQKEGMTIISPVTLEILNSGKSLARRSLEIKGSFDLLPPQTVNAARSLTADLVTNITEETRRSVEKQIAAGIEAGKSNEKIAREMRPLVGLNVKQATAVTNYRNTLLEKNPGIFNKELNRKVSNYSKKQLIRRTRTIARTESSRIQTQGYIDQLSDEGVEKVEFIATDPCEVCASYDGQIYFVAESRDMIPVHPNCRCAFVPVIE